MKMSLFHIAVRSILHDLKGVVNQILIIIILTAVITGSLLTGNSIRSSLRKTSSSKLGNTGIAVSSGIRYFDNSLSDRMELETGVQSTGILEIDGYCQNFLTGMTSPSVKIYAVGDDFFKFHGHDTISIEDDKAAVNDKLASYLGLKAGDDLILRFSPLSALPSDAPFSPDERNTESLVIQAGRILSAEETGNFSLAISQIVPMNIFISESALKNHIGDLPGINRMLLSKNEGVNVQEIYTTLGKLIGPGDIGLTIRKIPSTDGYEIISDRIFIDQLITEQIDSLAGPAFQTLTYLANSIGRKGLSTPYSFISGLDPHLYGKIQDSNSIIINRWLSEDLQAIAGDTLNITWFSPDHRNNLTVRNQNFIITTIVDMEGIWSDSLLMPEFPGIAGRESCSSWDAGEMINMDLIRKKDEDYWNKFKGTPKAFIDYKKALEIWGSNYGPVTSIRFGNDIDSVQISDKLSGSFDPSRSGFTLTDMPSVSSAAAGKSVDFSTLFLSLGFFIIFSALVLLIIIVSSFLESKKPQIRTLHSLGFTNFRIARILLYETGIIAFTGTLAGSLAGGIFNMTVIKALNSVWQGAVQTNTIDPVFYPGTVMAGFLICFFLIISVLEIRSVSFLRQLDRLAKTIERKPSFRRNQIISILLILATALVAAFSFVKPDYETMLSYASGITAFAAMIFIIRGSYLSERNKEIREFRRPAHISDRYYALNSSQAVAPVIFIAAGLFAVIITGVNRMSISDSMLERSGGTGGFLLWGESPVPVKGDLNSAATRLEFGLEESDFSDMLFVQAARTQGNDASCLNLNHITSPPLLGIDPGVFAERGSFSFASEIKEYRNINPWLTLDINPDDSTIYGIADQTVLQYGLQIKTGDTLRIRTENGQILNLVISAGLKSSVFQGYVVISRNNLNRFFPSVSGSQIFLVDGDPEMKNEYSGILNERMSEYGIHFEGAADRLASFFVVTNTYLVVFTILGGIGMILGVAGLGFVLIRNFRKRRCEFGLLMASGFSLKTIRHLLFRDHIKILLVGFMTGIISALLATRPSIAGSEIPWMLMAIMTILILISGLAALAVSIRSVSRDELVSRIRKE